MHRAVKKDAGTRRQRLFVLSVLTLSVLELAVALTDHCVPPALPIAYLYHVPIVLGAHWFGYVGALTCALSASLLFHITTTVENAPYGEADIVRLLTFLLVGLMVAEISRRRRETERLNRQLQELQATKELLTRHIVHDLRTPLVNLLLSLKILKGKGIEVKDTTADLIDIAIRGGEWLEGMINDLLSIQQMQEGALHLRLEAVPIEELVREATTFVRHLALQKDITLQVHIPSDLPPVGCERALMVRVLVNLLDNAFRFTPGEGAVTVDVQREKDGERHALFCVSDNGPGIPSGLAERIFDEFVQVEARENSVRSGTGLGLAFCQRVVEAHGGRIWVESQPGEGCRFYFSIPAVPLPVRGERSFFREDSVL